MVPTLEVGDYILVNKFSYGLRLPVTRTKILDVGEPERGDVMVFFPPHQNKTYYIKRVIGIPVTESLTVTSSCWSTGSRCRRSGWRSFRVVDTRQNGSEPCLETDGHLMQVDNRRDRVTFPLSYSPVTTL